MHCMIVEPVIGATPTATQALQRFLPLLFCWMLVGRTRFGETKVTTPALPPSPTPSPPWLAKAGEAGTAARLRAVVPAATALRVRRMGSLRRWLRMQGHPRLSRVGLAIGPWS